LYNLADAEAEATRAMTNINCMSDNFCAATLNVGNTETDALLTSVQLNIMRIAMREEFQNV
jgi:hypothetical protein